VRTGAGCVAGSGTGSASNDAGAASCGHAGVGCGAASGTGTASNDAGADPRGHDGVGCIAVSGQPLLDAHLPS